MIQDYDCSHKKLVLKICNYSVISMWISMLSYFIVISDNEKIDFVMMNTHCTVYWSFLLQISHTFKQ